MADAPDLVRIYLTPDPLAIGFIPEVFAQITDGRATYAWGTSLTCSHAEGRIWHRTRWAAENYCRQLQAERLTALRAEIARIEGYRFGRPGA